MDVYYKPGRRSPVWGPEERRLRTACWEIRDQHSEDSKTIPASRCAYYPPYLPYIVLKMTNIT